MFGIPSLGKLIILAIFIIGAWKILSYLKKKDTNNVTQNNSRNGDNDSDIIDTMHLCPTCQIYVSDADTRPNGCINCQQK